MATPGLRDDEERPLIPDRGRYASYARSIPADGVLARKPEPRCYYLPGAYAKKVNLYDLEPVPPLPVCPSLRLRPNMSANAARRSPAYRRPWYAGVSTIFILPDGFEMKIARDLFCHERNAGRSSVWRCSPHLFNYFMGRSSVPLRWPT